MKKLFVIAALSVSGMFANAADAVYQSDEAVYQSDDAPDNYKFGWYCGLDFKGHAEGFQVLFGRYDMRAEGTLKCNSDFFIDSFEQRVSIDFSTPPLALNVGLSSFDFVGGAAHITFIAPNPNVMFGKYILANANAAVFYGAGVYSATRVDTPSISMELALNVQRGFGLQAGFTIMNLEPLAPMEPEVPEFHGK